MTIWIYALLLVMAAVAFTLWPFLRSAQRTNRLGHAISFYEARKAELLRQLNAGEISATECEAAIAEQGRALIALERSEMAETAGQVASRTRRRKAAALAALAGVPLVALVLYARIGAPGYPDQPLFARKAAAPTLDIADAVQKIEAHLEKNPGDGRGYEVVAPVYLRAGRFDKASFAYRRVVELLGESPSRLADLGESLVAMEDGKVNPEARKAFERALALDAGMAKARFYLALAREQGGDRDGALTDLRAIEASLPDGPAKMRVTSEIARFGERKTSASPPGGEAGKAIASMPKAERDAAIRGMVEALEGRLATSGGTLEEWRRLVQSLTVLGEHERARASIERARKALTNDVGAGAVLDGLAAELARQPSTPAR